MFSLAADMGSGNTIRWSQLWLLAFLAFTSRTPQANGSPLEVMSAPNLLRVGTVEKVFVEIQDCPHNDNVEVEIRVMNHPTRAGTLASTTVNLTDANNHQGLGQFTIPADGFSKDPNMKQYVYLQANFPNRLLEKVVLVSFQSGYIFIQTDKTIYTPNSNVFYRIFALRPGMMPVEKDSQTQTYPSISTEIMTPDGIIIESNLVSLKSGIHSAAFKLGEIVSPGLWKLIAKFHSNPQQSFSAEFEVKEYVLPSFEVKLTSPSSFFHVNSEELTINIKATYLFGEAVDGTAYVVFGIITDDQKSGLPASLQRVMIQRGEGVVKLKKEHITETHKNILDLVGKSIFVSVSVLTESGSEMVEAELRGIQIVTSPYTIHFKKTRKYFKPGMSFDVVVEVQNPDKTPADHVDVVVEPGPVNGITGTNGMARLTINTVEGFQPLLIKAKTNDPHVAQDRQASAEMTASPYAMRSNNYLHIGVGSAELQLGDNLKIDLSLNMQINEQNDITYLILSRGQLVNYGHYLNKRQKLISLIIPITKEMLPSFRIVAYYHPTENEVVSDSVWVDVKDSCMGSLRLESSRGDSLYEPRRMFSLKVTGDPGATVGLVAVDKGVYVLNNKHRLTQKKVWDIVETYDTGCTPGGGRDSLNVFFDAGLVFESSTASGTPYRQDLKCPAQSRRKRARTISDVRTSLVSRYKNELQRDCCLDGMRDTPLLYSCERRSAYIIDGAPCIEAFIYCCKEMESQRAETKDEMLTLARVDAEDDSYMDSNEIVSRTQFPESWLWNDIRLPACPRENPNCVTTSSTRNEPLPDSITTWQFTGISLSSTYGICVADPLEVIVRKPFFIDLRLPYSAVRGEQLEIKAILHNYLTDPITVRVDLMENKDLCSVASKRGKFRQQVTVGGESTRAVPFIIIPMKHGEFSIEIKAAVFNSFLSDGIIKKLLVVPEGVLFKYPVTVILDPAKKGVGGKQVEIINSGIPMNDIVPNTPMDTMISLTGREQIGPLVENAISGNSMGTLIKEPYGCGEQNIARMALPVIATVYLDTTNQWETVGFDKRAEALQHILTGFRTELTFRKPDGSFAVYDFLNSNTWLTAYVVKVFAMANRLVALDRGVICQAVRFLILSTQQPDGMFKEVGSPIMSAMTGTDSEVSLTAFCLIALQESRTICANTVNSLPESIDKAVGFLERRLRSLTNPYTVAMTSYALANENKLNQEVLYSFVSPEMSHWPIRHQNSLTLEATAYALLSLVKAKAFEEARPVVRWFNSQQKVDGGYGPTQSTVMVYQAVAEYWANAEEPPYDLNVDILLPGRSQTTRLNINRENHYATRTSKFKGINKDLKVNATGNGEATLTMVSLYYALPKVKESDCKKFDLTLELLTEKAAEGLAIYKLRIHVLYKDTKKDARMTILDVGLLTGFTVETNDLDLLSKGHARSISKYEMNTVLSERGSLIIYLEKVSHTEPEEITFRLNQKFKVGILQPAAVSVYEYYDKTHCVKFYHPEREEGELLRLCTDDQCTCAEENCSMQKSKGIKNEDRTMKICEATETSKVDYAYKVRMDGLGDGLSTDIYTMYIMEVIKDGSYDVGPQGTKRVFLSYPHCRKALNLIKGKTYLIMGISKDVHRDEKNNSYQYVLGENTWIEYWPTEEECQTDEHRFTCLGLDEMAGQYNIFGCQQ